ncbi:type IIS restriction enzyme protein [Helicobacter pylori Hp H-6]|uniref:Type IIS restriction enzyme protein n=1 Tax=Helicobacter pylori Hp H-6 TaxID=992061 RepID=J0D0R8_HELPX|nr:type IIS restriction enzyme protein [Helicobacter pylori Hp H-6]
MIGPLSSQLNAIKWGEFKLGDLFEKRTMRGYPKKDENLTENKNGYHVFGQNIKHQYPQKVLLDEKYLHRMSPKKPILAYASSVGEIGLIKESFYRSGNNGAFQGLFPRFKDYNVRHLLFILSKLKNIFNDFGYATGMSDVLNLKFSLPLKPTAKTQTLEDIDFDFMEKFIAELEQCRLAELQAYLKAAGLENTTLSSDEENALNVFNNSGGGGNTPCGLTWQSFKLGDLFEIEKTLSFNKDALTQGGDYDYITRTSQNQGVLQTTGFVNAENLNPPFTWNLGLLQMDFFYRKKSWYAGQFMRKITPKTEIKNKINSHTAHYFTTLLNTLKRPLLSVLVRDIDKTFREQKIQLPLKPTAKTQTLNDIDFNFMHTFINALMKQTIQGVAQYCDAKIQATKEIISQEAPVQKDSLF